MHDGVSTLDVVLEILEVHQNENETDCIPASPQKKRWEKMAESARTCAPCEDMSEEEAASEAEVVEEAVQSALSWTGGLDSRVCNESAEADTWKDAVEAGRQDVNSVDCSHILVPCEDHA